jgi:uncharacterized protein YcbK (DUF882 family)
MKYFTSQELACKHCGVNKTTPELQAALDAFRELAGQPVIVDDAYRCPVHNAEVGGVKGSQHVLGTAADIRIEGLTAMDLYRLAVQIPAFENGGIGRDDHENYLHVDVRTTPARWCYGTDGKQIPWYGKS